MNRILNGLSLLTLLSFMSAVPAHGMEKEQFLEVLTALQGKVRNVEIRVSTTHFKVDKNQDGAWKELPSKWTARLVLEGPGGGKSRLDVDSSLPWYLDGKLQDEPGRMVEEQAYNGKIGTYIRRVPSDETARGPALNQHILPDDPNSDSMTKWTMENAIGIDLIAAYFKGKGLSQFLRDVDEWEITDLGNDVFTVTYVVGGPDGFKGKEEVTVDLGRGAAILGTKILHYRGFAFTNVELREGKDGIWLPTSAQNHQLGEVYKISFESVEINQDLPENTFVLDFDPGFQVWDRIHDMKFIAGVSPDIAPEPDMTAVVVDVEDPLPLDNVPEPPVSQVDRSNTPSTSGAPARQPVSRISRRMIAVIIALILAVFVAAGALLFGLMSTKRKEPHS